jgi:hypothetical protein
MRRAARAMVEERLGLEGFRAAVLRPLGPPRRRAEVDASVPPPGRIAVFARGGVA